MDHLTKQQLVLLALLLSFVTSLATGIVTVSLMDQAPSGVTHTVSQVIEKTIQQVSAPQSAAVGTVTLSVDDQIANAVASVSPGTVKIEDTHSNTIVGLGLIVSKEGIILTDKSIIAPTSSYEAVFSDGTIVLLNIMTTNSDSTFLKPSTASPVALPTDFLPITPAPSFTLGQSVFSLSGTSTAILGQGVITDIAASSSVAASSISPIGTSIPDSKTMPGSPLFDIKGNVVGIRVNSSFESIKLP